MTNFLLHFLRNHLANTKDKRQSFSMVRYIWCLLAISLTLFVDAAKSDYGVGFELTLDYA